MKSVVGIAAFGLCLASCQSLSGVDDLKVVSDAEYEAADPDGPGGSGTMKPPPAGDDTAEPPPVGTGGGGEDTPLSICIRDNCDDEYAICAESACADTIDCVLECDYDGCANDCVAGLTNEEIDAQNEVFACILHCDEQLTIEACLVGVSQFCECGAGIDNPCDTATQQSLEQCCVDGPDTCTVAKSLACLPDFSTNNTLSCNDAFNSCNVGGE